VARKAPRPLARKGPRRLASKGPRLVARCARPRVKCLRPHAPHPFILDAVSFASCSILWRIRCARFSFIFAEPHDRQRRARGLTLMVSSGITPHAFLGGGRGPLETSIRARRVSVSRTNLYCSRVLAGVLKRFRPREHGPRAQFPCCF